MKNNNIELIKTIFDELIAIFTSAGEINWLNVMYKFRQRIETSDINEIRCLLSEILTIYGGMGSFNDLVLYKDDKLLQQDTIRLDSLRQKLFDAIMHELH